MTAKIHSKSAILAAVHETASEMYRLGFIDKRKMERYNSLCLMTQGAATTTKVAASAARIRKR